MKTTFSTIAMAAIIALILCSLAALPLSTQAELSNENEWQLTISGLVNHPMNLSTSEIADMTQTTVQAAMFCVDFPNQIVTTGNWTGVQLADLLEKAGVSQSTIKVAFFASYGYSTDLSLEAATQPDVIVAYEKDGEQLPETLRLVVPGKWGYKWISQLTKIELVDFDFKGKWESQGYSDEGTVTENSRTSTLATSTRPNLMSEEPNETTTPPPSPNPISPPDPILEDSSGILAPQGPENSASENAESQNIQNHPIAQIIAAFLVSATVVVAGATLMVHIKKRKN
jgi:hypothetical protein